MIDNCPSNRFRWPWPPLHAALRDAGYLLRREQTDALGINLRTRERWRAQGVPDKAADHAAITIGMHPLLIWPEWNDHVVIEDDDQADGAEVCLSGEWRLLVASLRLELEEYADAG